MFHGGTMAKVRLERMPEVCPGVPGVEVVICDDCRWPMPRPLYTGRHGMGNTLPVCRSCRKKRIQAVKEGLRHLHRIRLTIRDLKESKPDGHADRIERYAARAERGLPLFDADDARRASA